MCRHNSAADALGLVSTQREPIESAVKASLDVKEEKRRAKEERRAKKRAEKVKEEGAADELAVDEDADAMDVDAKEDEEAEEKKRKRRKSDVAPAVEDGAIAMEGVET